MKLKMWCVNVILIIQILLIIFLSSECDNTKNFIVSKIITLLIILFNNRVLKKYTNLFD